MSRSALFLFGIAGVIAATGAACSTNPATASTSGGGSNTTSSGSSMASGQGGVPAAVSSTSGEDITVAVGTGGAGAGDCNSTMDEDKDKDGWSKAEGDCNDCDANVNPGAIEVKITMPQGDAGIPDPADEDCDGTADNVAPPCDTGLALADVDPADAAKAIDLCQTTTESPASKKDRKWGVLSSKYIGADGASPRTPGIQVGLFNKFGMNVKTQLGKSMLGLSSGLMRSPGEPGACPKVVSGQSCDTGNTSPTIPNFPQAVPGCPVSNIINDDIALEVKLRSPTNATGYKFKFKFYSYEFPEYVCTNFNDQFVALVKPAPQGAINGNISFDSGSHPVSVNIAFFDVCDVAGKSFFAKYCTQAANPGNAPCPTAPVSYCPSGNGDLLGTGMDGPPGMLDAGATSWLETSAPVKGGDDVTIRFAIWDTGDHNLDSSVLVDAFEWIANGGTVTVGTIKPPS